MHEVQKAAFASNTREAIARSWRLFLYFRYLHYDHPLPADSSCIRLFETFLLSQPSIKSPATIAIYVSHVKTCHRLLGFPTSAFDEPELKLFKRALGKTMVLPAKPPP